MTLEKILSLSVLAACIEYNPQRIEEEPIYAEEETGTNRGIEEPCVYTDNFVINHVSETCTDIIAVVDTSGSMTSDVTNNEIEGVQAYLTTFTRERLQSYPNPTMMVISTAGGEYTNTPVTQITAKTATWVLEPATGTVEAPLETLLTYVKSEHAATWMQDQCALSMMMFSDEDDQSYSTFSFDNEGDDAAVDQFINEIESIYNPETKEMYWTAAINPSTEYLCDIMVEVNQIGYRAEQLAAYYDGSINDICSTYDGWKDPKIPETQEPEEIGWRLTYIPESDAITVYIGDELATSACTYSDGVISYPFQENLVDDTEITITYQIDKRQYNNECPL